ncbi:hypothetical protein [Caballeronia sp. DA-9]|uniref:hypothetical protein n=1 Tax=Caballeronia sp. DA-9 TaxID=3436237 RepID=UPI003F66CEB9
MDMGCVAFQAHLATLLRGMPRCTTAELNDHTIVFWDGQWAKGAELSGDGSGQLLDKFDLDERTCNRLHADLTAWLASPRYGARPDLEEWIYY